MYEYISWPCMTDAVRKKTRSKRCFFMVRLFLQFPAKKNKISYAKWESPALVCQTLIIGRRRLGCGDHTVFHIKIMIMNIRNRVDCVGGNCPIDRALIDIQIVVNIVVAQAKVGIKTITHFKKFELVG